MQSDIGIEHERHTGYRSLRADTGPNTGTDQYGREYRTEDRRQHGGGDDRSQERSASPVAVRRGCSSISGSVGTSRHRNSTERWEPTRGDTSINSGSDCGEVVLDMANNSSGEGYG